MDRKKNELDSKCPTDGGMERLTEEFVVEYTYNSNAIEGIRCFCIETDMVPRSDYCPEQLKDLMKQLKQLDIRKL